MIDQKSHSTLEDQADARSRLATGLMLRYHQNGGFHLDDIKRAVSEVEMVLHLLPTNNPERWYHMRTLALCLKLRYLGSSSSCADLDRALQLLQDFLDGAPDCGSHGEDDFPFIPRRGVIVMMMAELFSIRSKWAWENDLKQGDYKADLDRCLEYAQKAVEMNEPDSIRNAIDTLSEAYATRYRQSSQRDGAGDPNDIDLAIKYRIAAAEQARKDGVGLSHILRQLAILYSLKRTLYGTQDGSTSPSSASLARRFLEMALEAYSQCSKSPDCSTYLQIQTLVESTPIHVALGQWAEAVDTWEQALDAMPNLNMRSASFADQEFQIKEYAGQSARVVSASILSGRRSPADSLRLLERGRGMIASFLQIRRADISALDPLQSSAFTEALSRWDEMRRQVQDAGAGFEGGGQQKQQQQSETGIWASQSQKFRRAEYELRSVIQDIQTDPRTSDLLGPPSIDTVRSLLGSDTIVVFNVSTLRCDAFLISNSPATPGVSLLELKQVTAVGIMIWVDRLRATRPLIDSQMLEWLWTDITRPILDFLGFKVDGAAIPSTTRPVASHSSYNDSAPLPRIIWIPTGPICHLPLHAAGIHISRGSSVMDHVISSYSPSLKEFVLGRKQLLSSPPPAFRASSTSALEPSSISSEAAAPTCSTAPSTVQKALLIGASNPSSQPGRPHTLQSLPFVSTEIDQVSAICHALNLNPVSLQDPTRESVLDSLPATTIFHFAGHGLADAREPSRSALILADGHLTVSSLLDQGLESRGDDVKTRPYLAFLSACLTGANDIDELADEGIHLIAAFQLIGFSHVIGTLWQVADSACVDVSVGVYQGLHDSSSRGSGGDGMSTRPAHESVCRSLHRTLVNLRDEWRVGIESSMLPTREDEDEKSDEIVELPGVGISACGDERRPVTERSVTSEEEDDNVKRWASLKLGKKVKSPRRLVRADWIPYVHYGS
ncbi:CHAT domain-containing protein [Rhypophila decipiens]|uniref:CHAT domain-containing protein n=1 Tax=Rhypophila decipiens TaxID=261697 RepID=A0AAN6XUI0_9PEZI|nr:CHAT domain-containing protein [Rhypophila decipiens]